MKKNWSYSYFGHMVLVEIIRSSGFIFLVVWFRSNVPSSTNGLLYEWIDTGN